MKTRILSGTFYIGISFLIIGALFKVQHWPGYWYFSVIGTSLELICMIVMTIEIFTSPKAKTAAKLRWGIPLIAIAIVAGAAFAGLFTTSLPLLLPFFVLGSMYLKNGRKQFLHIRGKHDHIKFDSIDV